MVERRMEAYYYGFNPTGDDVIDTILSAVACAGKACHHTDEWVDDTATPVYLKGKNPVEWIQNAAIDAAHFISALSEERDRYKEALENIEPLYAQPAGSADPEPAAQPVSCETCSDRAWCQQGRSCIHQGVSRELLLATISLTDAMRQKLLEENALLNKEIQVLRRKLELLGWV